MHQHVRDVRVLILATIALGHVLAIAQPAAIPLMMVATALVEDLPEVRRTGRTEISSFGRTARPD
jgi:hypothetical protein